MDMWYQMMEWLLTIIFIIIVLFLIDAIYQAFYDIHQDKQKQSKNNNNQHY